MPSIVVPAGHIGTGNATLDLGFRLGPRDIGLGVLEGCAVEVEAASGGLAASAGVERVWEMERGRERARGRDREGRKVEAPRRRQDRQIIVVVSYGWQWTE